MGRREAQRDGEGRVRRLVTGIGSEMNQMAVIEMVRRGHNPNPRGGASGTFWYQV